MTAGAKTGYKDAKSIIDKLEKDETIKIITNSMGAAFERGFTDGLLKYQTEENARRTASNEAIDKQLTPLYQQKQVLETLKGELFKTKNNFTKALNDVNSKISALESQKKEMLNVQIEMVIDLSSHKVDLPDPNAQMAYFMLAGKENMNLGERTFVDETFVRGAKYLGEMSGHHSSNADPNKFPSAKKRN